MRRLKLRVEYDAARLRAIPAVGPVVTVANHPFGVLDGIVISHLVAKVRTDFKVLPASLSRICYRSTLPERPRRWRPTYALVRTRCPGCGPAAPWWYSQAAQWRLPRRMFARRAVDPEWKLFAAKAIARTGATVVPTFFEGQNSPLSQLASHVSLTLRLSLLFNEVRNKIGSVVAVRIGAPVPYAELGHLGDRRALADHLRRMTYALGGRGDSGAPRSVPYCASGNGAICCE